MIEDKELRDLFKIESEEHIRKLEDGFLRLEKEPKNQPLLEEVFREAHSLKGAARMLGLTGIQDISHSIEDILGNATKGKTVLKSETIDRLYKGLDAIKNLVKEALTGEKSEVDVKEVLDFISGVKEVPKEKKSKVQVPKSEIEESEIEKLKIGEFKIETVRVDTKRLDTLMTQVGELSVTKGRVAHRNEEIEDIMGELEELEKSSEWKVRSTEIKSKLQNLKSKIGEDSSRLSFIADELEDGVYKIRLLPMSTIFSIFPRMVRDMARERLKDAKLIIEGGDTKADKRIIEDMKDPLMHMIRNAIDHGIEAPDERERIGKARIGSIILRAYQTSSNVVIEVKDDGKGLDIETIKNTALRQKIHTKDELSAMTPSQIQYLIFVSGFSTSPVVTDVSGRGIGLDVVRANVEGLKGNIHVESTAGEGCTLRIKLPITLATIRVLIVGINGMKCTVPVEYVQTSLFITKDDIFTIEGRDTIVFDGQPISVAKISELLEVHGSEFGDGSDKSKIQISKSKIEKLPCIILSVGTDRLGVIVDELIDEQEIVIKPQSRILRRVRNVSGSTILGTGEVCTVLSPQDMIKTVRKREAPQPTEKPSEEIEMKKSILLVEDSITTRTQERRILIGAGYEVIEAVDGVDALNKLGSHPFDAVVSDILMPNMDGLTLTKKIREDRRYSELPVILVTSLASNEDRKKGLEAGANAYIAKPAFDQQLLLETLKRLI
ncbi:MAG: hybrid sensor histidine kinase/response regulator [Nitrospirota bacterium]